MRDLSDAEIKRLYESEYKNVPDVWDKVTDRIPLQEQADEDGSSALYFAKLGRKRWVKLAGAMAACFVIIFAYVLQNGAYVEKDAANETAVGGTEAALPAEDDSLYINAEDAMETDADNGAATAAGTVDSETASRKEETNQEKGHMSDAMPDISTRNVRLFVGGVTYLYDETLAASADELEKMIYLGEVVYTEDASHEDLTISGFAISGKAYKSAAGEIYVLDTDTNQVYGFR